MRSFCVPVIILFSSFFARGQSTPDHSLISVVGKSIVELKSESTLLKSAFGLSLLSVSAPAGTTASKSISPLLPLPAYFQNKSAAPAVYSYDELGIFCKLEVQLERTAKIPIKIRLGDVEYVDYLEGKRERSGNY